MIDGGQMSLVYESSFIDFIRSMANVKLLL